MRIAICDDNPQILEQLYKYINEFFRKNNLKTPHIATFSSGEALLCDRTPNDIVFLDIEMPGVDGIYVGNKLKEANPKTIILIVTSFAEYLDEAMRFQVFRYLSKPIEKMRLFRNLRDALKIYNSSNTKVAITTKDGVFPVSTSDIICVEAQMRKVIIHTTSKDYFSTQNMQHWIDTLTEPCFFQSHRSFIVNLEHITDFNNSVIHLYNSQFTAYLTRRKYTEFKATYLLYLESMR